MASIITAAQAAVLAVLDGAKGAQFINDIDQRTSTSLFKVKAGTLFKTLKDLVAGIDAKLVGSASAGVASPEVKFTAEVAAGALPVPTLPVLVALTIANAADNTAVFTALPGKHRVVDVWVRSGAGGAADTTYVFKNGDNAITDAITPGATAGAVKHAATIAAAQEVISSGASIKVTWVRGAGGSSAAVVYALMVPVA